MRSVGLRTWIVKLFWGLGFNCVEEFETRDLILVPSKFEKTSLSDQIPDDDVGILGATCQLDIILVECQICDCRPVSVECDEDRRNGCVPNPDATIAIPVPRSDSKSLTRAGGCAPNCK